MIRRAVFLFLIFPVLILSGCATTGGPGAGSKGLQAVHATGVEVRDNAVELTMDGDFPSSYTVYKPDDPFTVVVDMPGVQMGKAPAETQSEKKGISEVRLSEVQEPSRHLRMEVLLTEPAELLPRKEGNALVLAVAGTEPGPEQMMGASSSGETPEDPATAITDISFRVSEKTLKLIIKGNGRLESQIFTLDDRIIVDIPDVAMEASIPDKVLKPVTAIRTGAYDGKTRIVVEVEEGTEFAAKGGDGAVVLAIPLKVQLPEAEITEAEELAAPPPEQEKEAPKPLHREYTGKLISLDFQDADIVPIFRFIGDVAGVNVVIHPSVKGKITLKLLNVPWDQALDIVLEISNLGKSFEDNILKIAPNEVFTKQKEEEARLKGARVKAARLVQHAIHLKHIDANDLEKRLQESKALSPRGTVRIDERTNTLIVNDTEENIKDILEREVPFWDTPEHGVLQVMIEAKIVEVSTNTTRQLGIRWGGSFDESALGFTSNPTQVDFSVNTPVRAAGPAAVAPGSIISVGYTDTVSVNLSLEALETVSKVRNLANPKVLTIDKQPASIKQGVQIPFSTVSSEGTKTEFQEATLSLEVTPEIQPNGILKLQVMAKNDRPQQVADQTGINKQEIKTQALVKDGETLVLGGIYTSTEEEQIDQVPILGRIPLLGWLFKVKRTNVNPRELLIFITPKIVGDG
ncbi:MAG: type IV pilus secretin PilQ [Nitrospirota bacterium]